MPSSTFASELAALGPGRPVAAPPGLEESREYCRSLARSHYENFAVASLLLPRALRPHFHAVYAYCRWADDLADETGNREQSLELLDWWQGELLACHEGGSQHPVFVALAATIAEFDIPQQPFLDLLVAFRQDQRQLHYASFADLENYCRYSANPVGHLVLYLGRCHDAERAALSDHVCTALQLANFWQDVAQDWRRGRIYLPQEDCQRFGYTARDFSNQVENEAFRKLLEFQVDRAEAIMRQGEPLVAKMPRALQGDIWLFIQGGLAILSKIRQVDYNVWSRRPKIAKTEAARLLARCLWGNWRGTLTSNQVQST